MLRISDNGYKGPNLKSTVFEGENDFMVIGKMSDRNKWEDFWYIQTQIGNYEDKICTYPSWSPDINEKKKYLAGEEPIYPGHVKNRKFFLEIIDHRGAKKKCYDIKTKFMTITDNGSWNAENEELKQIKASDGLLLVEYPDLNRNVQTVQLYLITKTELIEHFQSDRKGRIHFAPNDGSLDDYKLPKFDNVNNVDLKLKLNDICDRLKCIYRSPRAVCPVTTEPLVRF